MVSAFSLALDERKTAPAIVRPVKRSMLLSVQSHGVCFGVVVNSRAMWELVETRSRELIPGAIVNRPGRIQWVYTLEEQGANRPLIVHSGRRRLALAQSRIAALQWMCSDLQMKMAEMSEEFVFIHAGVVGWNGRAIILPGRSFSGKSTLVAELLRRGATYYSDEYAVFSTSGEVHPFPCPLHVRSQRGTTRRRVPAHLLDAKIGGEPLPAGLVLFLSFRRGEAWRTRRLSPGEGMLTLLRNAVAARHRPHATVRALRPTVLSAPSFRGWRGEAGLAAEKIFELSNLG